MRFSRLLHGFMSLFPCPSKHSLRSSNLPIQVVLEEMAWQGYFGSPHFKVTKFGSKSQGIDWRSCHAWTRLCSHWSQMHISINSRDMEVVVVAMSSCYHPQQLIFTKHLCWYNKCVQNCQSSSRHFS